MDKQITAHDVARLAGVSQSTVSRVFTEGASVSDGSRKKVLKAAEELGYQPNEFARSLIMRKTRLIGLVMKNVDNPFYPAVLKKFTATLRSMGYGVLLIDTAEDELCPRDIEQLIAYKVAGVVIMDATASFGTAEALKKNGIPAVLFNRVVEETALLSVSCDNRSASREIALHLIEDGCESFVYIAGKRGTSTNLEREQSFTETLQAEGYRSDFTVGGYTYDGGFKAVKNLPSENMPDAIFAANDIMAMGALDALKEMRLQKPVRLIGFDDIPMASWPGYALSTYKQPVDRMIEKTLGLLLGEGEERGTPAGPVYLEGELIIRET
ncbi:LacI family DNA-binding transcriptional regulator [Edaphobacillus lindanitolerans]|uniref:DNA-binding transcriptional regulator, LacI/PurR family n=1 Tax=Edaphobacillus lindanitolerans TaxID=550447 RepID=A0A1U7PNW3_9BACI|nr:LacI family DNA-binding transcriptional regulator [Edaphobacillus lindanitolerans]SIT80035.1 DNA-binding transcriptional regulator, LacI/PurR family [Edaphobacillus lindanitolerans]